MGVGGSPGLSCCCTFPPREILTFSAQLTLCPAFISEGMNSADMGEKKRDFPSIGLLSISSGGGRCGTVLGQSDMAGGVKQTAPPSCTHATVKAERKLDILFLQRNPKYAVTIKRFLSGHRIEAHCHLITLCVLE